MAWGIIGCSELPPQKSSAIQYFYQHREALESLVDAVANDRRTFVDRSEVAGLVVYSANPLPPELIGKYKALYEKAGDIVSTVRVESNATRIDISVPYSAVSRNFSLSYLHSNDSIDEGSCDRNRFESRCGFCSLPIESPWYLSYRWTPTDLGLELEDHIGSDDVDHREMEDLSAELVRECFLEGMSDS
jgi:hypothetical protein